MAELAEALDAALRARYRYQEVKRPATHRQGLLARIGRLEKLFGTRGKAAAAAGIPYSTWRDWTSGRTKPSARGLRKLEAAYVRNVSGPAFKRAVNSTPLPNTVRVTGEIKWSSSPRKQYNRVAQRTVNLEGMQGVMRAVVRAWATAGPEAAAETLERGASAVYRVPDDNPTDKHPAGAPGIEIEGDRVEIEFR
ncbi:helix-turn-helix domain-containing protein [Streptomyces longwoodensis]|uniref:helix-turn-helix domain-containing protein n=1 Tax=Streptomyces longwoodensis TaxID=68231 RepID=UPI00380C62E6